MHRQSFVLLILTYKAFSHDSTGRRPYAEPAYQTSKGDSGGGGGKREENLPLPHRQFAPAPLAIHLLKTWVLKVSTKVVHDHNMNW